MTKRTILISMVVIAIAAFLFAEEKTKWINIKVTEPAEETQVDLHLPLSLVTAALDGIKTKDFNNGKISLHIEDADIDFVTLLKEVKKAPDGEFVKVTSKDANVSVVKQGGTIIINVDEKEKDHAKVEVKVPAALLDAIIIDEKNQLDIKNLISTLEKIEIKGDLVKVTSKEADVRIWIE